MMNVYARTQVKCKNGRIDFVVLMPETTWVFELKVNGTAQEALEQINSKGYAIPYQTEGRRVVKVGVQFARDTMTVGEWVVEQAGYAPSISFSPAGQPRHNRFCDPAYTGNQGFQNS